MDKSMTGDGAVVLCGCGGGPALVWTTNRRHKRTYQRICSMCVISTNHYDTEADADAAWNRAMQAAEIERLTQMVEAKAALVIEACQLAFQLRHRAEASEARTADLLKALEKYGEHIVGECAKWHQPSDYSGWMRSDAECTCGLAAAKGETV